MSLCSLCASDFSRRHGCLVIGIVLCVLKPYLHAEFHLMKKKKTKHVIFASANITLNKEYLLDHIARK